MNHSSQNAAWQAAQKWRERTQNAKPSAGQNGIKALFTWLLFGVLLIVGTFLGLFFLLIGWAMLPFVRKKMQKQQEQMRASRAEYAGSNHTSHSDTKADNTSASSSRILDGEYEVRS